MFWEVLDVAGIREAATAGAAATAHAQWSGKEGRDTNFGSTRDMGPTEGQQQFAGSTITEPGYVSAAPFAERGGGGGRKTLAGRNSGRGEAAFGKHA